MGFYFDITAPYPGGQSAPYIPRFEPLSPFNDGTTGQGAGQGIPTHINLLDYISKDQEKTFYALYYISFYYFRKRELFLGF